MVPQIYQEFILACTIGADELEVEFLHLRSCVGADAGFEDE